MELLEIIINPAQLEAIASRTGATIIYGSEEAVPSFKFCFDAVSADNSSLTAYTLSECERQASVTIDRIDEIRLICQPDKARDAYALIYNNGLITALCLKAAESIYWPDTVNS